MSKLNLTAQLEALLFASPEPLSVGQLAGLTEQPARAVQAALEELRGQLTDRGIRLSEAQGTYRLVTAPAASSLIDRLGRQAMRADLTAAALETLALIAYEGPITKSAIDQLRGVSSDSTVQGLLGRGLIVEAGRSPEPGKPLLFAVSHSFLEQFGLTSTQDLPRPAVETTPAPAVTETG